MCGCLTNARTAAEWCAAPLSPYYNSCCQSRSGFAPRILQGYVKLRGPGLLRFSLSL